MALKLVWMALAGSAGTLARFGLSSVIPSGFLPWGTMAVNMLGSFAFGVVWSAAGGRGHLNEEVRLIVLVGFMGAFTTFSTFAFDTVDMLSDGKWLQASGNLLGQNALGLVFVSLGILLGRAFS